MKNILMQKQNQYSDRLDKKTMEYQRKYGFALNPLEGRRTWNVEADAFKHAFMGADLSFDYTNTGSFLLGVIHEAQTKNNPQGEWNMDSWNNNKGREIANELRKEYGVKIYKLSDKERSDIIADKIMQKMRAGELITDPTDIRQFNGKIENFINGLKKKYDNFTGGASELKPDNFTYDFTREYIGGMSSKEFEEHENEIMKQLKTVGVPSERDLPKGEKSCYSNEKSKGSSSSNSSSDGK